MRISDEDTKAYFAAQKKRAKKKYKKTKNWSFTTDIIYFRRMLGNPLSKLTGQIQDLAPFQVDYHMAIQTQHRVIMNKSRKLGATETVNTSFALNVFDRYAGHDILYGAGNELKVAREVLYRLYELFMDKDHPDGRYAFRYFDPEYIPKIESGSMTWEEAMDGAEKIHESDLIRKKKFGPEPTIEFTNGTRAFAWAMVRQEKAQSFRGADDLIAIFFTEAAHTGMRQDQSAMNALKPNLAQRDDADFILESTPNGRRGFYYNYWMESMKVLGKQFDIPVKDDTHQTLVDRVNALWKKGKYKKDLGFILDWFPFRVPYQIGIDHNILSKKFIESEKRDPEIDFKQEYECYFTSTYSSAIDTSNLKFVPDDVSAEYRKKYPKDLLELVGKKSVQY
ncbi:hypothetical protein SU86_000870 [Candidatus Nitrosotenuis cloacae]|uniref:Uncharacterized protein n=2 Tax=Candidatus Nitrosotenuis cloacae TaxID=1603555 RepID=A0A3G1AZZ6_9ARCH|nr:hypothetical protein SU86_000870 [Candidatus Nitrosotenuis cloacae]